MKKIRSRILSAILAGAMLLPIMPLAKANGDMSTAHGWQMGKYGVYEFSVENENENKQSGTLVRQDRPNSILPIDWFGSIYNFLQYVYEQEGYSGFPVVYDVGLYSLIEPQVISSSDQLFSENCIRAETPYKLIVLDKADAITTPKFAYNWLDTEDGRTQLCVEFEDVLEQGYYECSASFSRNTGTRVLKSDVFFVGQGLKGCAEFFPLSVSDAGELKGEPKVVLRRIIAELSDDKLTQTVTITKDPEENQDENIDVDTQQPSTEYIYNEVDSGKTIDFAGTLDNVTDETSAMDAVDKALTEVTDEQKQSITGIDKLTLLAEEAAAKANTVSVDSGVINVTPEDIPATADSALTATTGVLSDAGVNMQRNPRTIVNYDAGNSETVSVTTESLPETVDKVRVTTDYAMATVDAQQASSFTMSDQGNQTIEVNFDTDYETVVTVSFPGMSANDTYKAVVDAEGKPVGGKYNPATGTLEAKLTESGVYRVVNNEADFTDIKSKSQEMQDAIKELASKGIINGTTETTYAPDDTISRAEVTALLMRTLSLLNPNANGGFADVTSANWYCGAAGSAKEHNIINGFEDNTFRGDAVIAKDQIVAVSSRTLREQMNYKTPSDVNGELSVYSDAGSIENWAREDVALATMTNLVLKRTDGKFDGSAGMTRGDAAIIIKRLFDKMW